jgi:tetratricopeptide (TPR) repeat protein
MKNIIYKWTALLLTVVSLSACEKYLDAKPDQALATPSTLKDLEAILNHGQINNLNTVAGDIMTDDYFLEEPIWKALTDITARDSYIFGQETYHDFDWQNGYNLLFRANVALDGLAKVKIQANDQQRVNTIKGSALFLRAYAHYHLIQVFALAYQKSTAEQTLGIPLKLSSDINEQISRRSLAECYALVINDLKEAVELLPPRREFKTQPSKAACYQQLARVYLIMHEYDQAGDFASKALAIDATLMDYNSINAATANPFSLFNQEVVFQGFGSSRGGVFIANRARVDTQLYLSYANNDLRKIIFFNRNSNGSYAFKGDYSGRNNGNLFAGLAIDELYLIKAEAEVRQDRLNEGLSVLNQLLIKRWKTGTFTALTTSNKADALRVVLLERRKELLFRTNIRWSDIKRLSFDAAHAITVERKIGSDSYQLPVGDLRYANLIPINTVVLSQVIQNKR